MRLLKLFFIVPLFSVSAVADVGLENIKQMGKAFANVAKKASPAVVFIKVEKEVMLGGHHSFGGPLPFDGDLFEHFFRGQIPNKHRRIVPQQKQRREVGQGSGFIISKDGYILTNNHVIGNADKILVKLLDGREFKAKTIGTDPQTDIAVIKIKANDLPILPLGNSESLEVGEWVIAVGNPFGLSHTLTAGIVSAKGRSNVGITNYENFIQTDAAINPGNSGGPLINLDGKAVGMNTAIMSRNGGSMGIGFAIPMTMVEKIKDQLLESGKVIRGYLGIGIQNLDSKLAKSFKIKDKKGILVTQVSPGSPADDAGFRQGDVISTYDGEDVNEVGNFRNKVSLTRPGKLRKIGIFRNGKDKILRAKIGTMPGKYLAQSNHRPDASREGIRDKSEKLGIEVRASDKGVEIVNVSPNSSAALAGLGPGDVIVEINRKKVKNLKSFDKAIKRADLKNGVLLLIVGQEGHRYVSLSVG